MTVSAWSGKNCRRSRKRNEWKRIADDAQREVNRNWSKHAPQARPLFQFSADGRLEPVETQEE